MKTLFDNNFTNYKLVPINDRKKCINFHQSLKKAQVEEEVKSAYVKLLEIPFDSKDMHDLYHPNILFEFKHDKDFQHLKPRAEVLAQLIYYIHNLKYNPSDKSIPPYLCMADRNEVIITETHIWELFFSDEKNIYDWTFAPSSPDMKLISDLLLSQELKDLNVYNIFDVVELQNVAERLKTIIDEQYDLGLTVKKSITERNFEDVYCSWETRFGEAVRNGFKPSQYFLCDLQEGKSFVRPDEGRVYFKIDDENTRQKKINLKEYDFFWNLYQKTHNTQVIRGILSKADRITDETLRRFEGEFYTPVKFASLAIDYFNCIVGKESGNINWQSGDYRLWDMACGTGNLEYNLPAVAYPYCYLSTLHSEDVIHCKKLFRNSKVFQYDYLNDDIDNLFNKTNLFHNNYKLPEELRNDLDNPKIKWIILLNPPFATSQNKSDSNNSKKDVSMTELRKYMHKKKMGETSRELFSQFLYRIDQEFKGKQAWLGLFSTMKYINSNNDQKMRDIFFKYKFEKGFIFDSRNFDGVKGAFPVGFLIWNLQIEVKMVEQNIVVDVYERNLEKSRTKTIEVEHREQFLSKWIDRPDTVNIMPPFSSALNINGEKKDVRDRVSENFICSLCCKGNDRQNNNSISLFSGPYGSAGALSVTPDNFEKAMIIHAVRKLSKGDWTNDRDQYYQPSVEIQDDFILNCVVWSLFSPSNQTVALSNVVYKNIIYQIPNNLFPFTRYTVSKWGIQDPDISITIENDQDRFASLWLKNRVMGNEAEKVMKAAKAVYKLYFKHLNFINTKKYAITTWDAGFYQVINSLKSETIAEAEIEILKKTTKKLAECISAKVQEYGFQR